MIKRILISSSLIFISFLATSSPILADDLSRPVASPGAIPTVGNLDKTKLPILSLNELVKNGVLIAIALAGLVFFFMLILGGLKYLTSGGDEKAAAAARGTLTNAFIGLIIVVAAFLIAQLLFTIFKVPGISVTN